MKQQHGHDHHEVGTEKYIASPAPEVCCCLADGRDDGQTAPTAVAKTAGMPQKVRGVESARDELVCARCTQLTTEDRDCTVHRETPRTTR